MTDTKTDREVIAEMTEGRPTVFFYKNTATRLVQSFLMDKEVHIASFQTGSEFCYCFDKWISENRERITKEMALEV